MNVMELGALGEFVSSISGQMHIDSISMARLMRQSIEE